MVGDSLSFSFPFFHKICIKDYLLYHKNEEENNKMTSLLIITAIRAFELGVF